MKDVFDFDRQDDGRSYRMLCSDIVQLALRHPSCIGLVIYLFIFGEMCDSWLSQTASHLDRLVSAFMAHFFLKHWYSYLKERAEDSNGMMSVDRNGISHQSFKIFSQLAPSLLSLIIAHREFYPGFPFLPWKHGTKACEHIFGWMRVIFPKFTFLDALQMGAKLFTIVKNIMTDKISMPTSEHIHSGKT